MIVITRMHSGRMYIDRCSGRLGWGRLPLGVCLLGAFCIQGILHWGGLSRGSASTAVCLLDVSASGDLHLWGVSLDPGAVPNGGSA